MHARQSGPQIPSGSRKRKWRKGGGGGVVFREVGRGGSWVCEERKRNERGGRET